MTDTADTKEFVLRVPMHAMPLVRSALESAIATSLAMGERNSRATRDFLQTVVDQIDEDNPMFADRSRVDEYEIFHALREIEASPDATASLLHRKDHSWSEDGTVVLQVGRTDYRIEEKVKVSEALERIDLFHAFVSSASPGHGPIFVREHVRFLAAETDRDSIEKEVSARLPEFLPDEMTGSDALVEVSSSYVDSVREAALTEAVIRVPYGHRENVARAFAIDRKPVSMVDSRGPTT